MAEVRYIPATDIRITYQDKRYNDRDGPYWSYDDPLFRGDGLGPFYCLKLGRGATHTVIDPNGKPLFIYTP
jgi:hypothetical protein